MLECAGAGFDYARSPTLFGGRSGHGPLLVAWDTCVVIDLAEHSEAIWESKEDLLPGGSYGEEMAALMTLVSYWMSRDTRFAVDEAQFGDAKKPMGATRMARRETQITEILMAMACTLDRPPVVAQPPDLPEIDDFGDRAVAREAIARGCHVLLTRDDDRLPPRLDLRPHGLVGLTPIDLLTELLVANEPTFSPCERGDTPDSHKVTHLRNASLLAGA